MEIQIRISNGKVGLPFSIFTNIGILRREPIHRVLSLPTKQTNPFFFFFLNLRKPALALHLTTLASQWNRLLNRHTPATFDILLSYASMLRNGTVPHPHTFPSLLKACSSLSHALTLHQHILVFGYASDLYIASSLIHTYSKCGHILLAHQVFENMPQRNVVPWTAIVGAYSQMGDSDSAFSLYNQMRHQGIEPNSVTLLGLLSGAWELFRLQCVHACVVRFGFGDDLVVVNSLLNVYGRCGSVEGARKLFDGMCLRDVVSWNCLISGYAGAGDVREAVHLLNRMRSGEMKPDRQTFGSVVVSAAAEMISPELGKLVHAQIIISGFESDMHIKTALIGMYLKFGYVDEAFQLFDRIIDKDVISWTAMISGLVQNERADEALRIFQKMLMSRVPPSTATIASALAASAQLASFNHGTSIHGFIIRQRMRVNVAAENSLLTMYAKCSHLTQCQALFNRMSGRDVVSWNSIIAAYAQNGHLSKVFLLFIDMREACQRPDSITMVSLLQACASMGALIQGKWVHNFMLRNGMEPSISVDTALIDMYAKCGDIETAQRCFEEMPEKDLVSWSVTIAGYGSQGKGETALGMYSDFLQTGIKPNHVLFLSVLTACSHAGLVPEGLRVFQSMVEDFRIEPQLEHHACVVDLFSRAGRVEEAYKFTRMMLPQPSADVLGILLDACRINGNADLGEVVAREILALKPVNAANYVQLAHSYAAMRRWDGVGEAWTQMRSLGLKKVPGWSSIELHGTISTFFVDHSSHPKYDLVMSMLKILDAEMRNRYSTLPASQM